MTRARDSARRCAAAIHQRLTTRGAGRPPWRPTSGLARALPKCGRTPGASRVSSALPAAAEDCAPTPRRVLVVTAGVACLLIKELSPIVAPVLLLTVLTSPRSHVHYYYAHLQNQRSRGPANDAHCHHALDATWFPSDGVQGVTLERVVSVLNILLQRSCLPLAPVYVLRMRAFPEGVSLAAYVRIVDIAAEEGG